MKLKFKILEECAGKTPILYIAGEDTCRVSLLFAHNLGAKRMPRTDYARSLIRTNGSSSDLERSQSLEIKLLRVVHLKIEIIFLVISWSLADKK